MGGGLDRPVVNLSRRPRAFPEPSLFASEAKHCPRYQFMATGMGGTAAARSGRRSGNRLHGALQRCQNSALSSHGKPGARIRLRRSRRRSAHSRFAGLHRLTSTVSASDTSCSFFGNRTSLIRRASPMGSALACTYLLHCVLKRHWPGARLPAPIITSGKMAIASRHGHVFVHPIAHAAADQKDNI